METLRLAFEYEPELTSKESCRDVRLEFFVSAHLAEHRIVTCELKSDKHNIDIPIRCRNIDPGAGLTIRAFSASVNDRNEPCYIGVGSAFFSVAELFHPNDHVTEQRDMEVTQLADMKAGTVPVKGRIRLHIAAMPNASIAAPTQYSYVAENAEFIAKQLNDYLEQSSVIYERLRPTSAAAEGLQLPLWKFGHVQTIGDAFVGPRAEPSPESWWSQAARIGLRRFHEHRMSDSMAETWLLSQATNTEVMCCIALMHAATIRYIGTYVSDGIYVDNKTMRSLPSVRFQAPGIAAPFTKLKPISARECANVDFVGMEQFQDAEFRRVHAPGVDASIDCEDGTAEVGLQAMELASAKFSDPILKKMQAVRRDYVICTALCYVNGAKISDETTQLGGHAVPVYVHKNYLLDMLERYNTARPVVPPQVCSRVSPTDTPVITVESTGLMWPIGDDERSERTLQRCSSLRVQDNDSPLKLAAFMMPNARSRPAPFYHTMASLMPLEFADYMAKIQHAMVQLNPTGAPTRGVPYASFIGAKKNVSLIPVVTLSTPLLRVTEQVLKHRYPIVAFEAPQQSYAADRRVMLESVRQSMRNNQPTSTHFSVYPRYSQVTQSFANGLRRFIESRNVVGFEFEEENVGGHTGGFRLTFYQ